MSASCIQLRTRGRKWAGWIGTLAVLTVLTVALGGLLGAAHGAPWYANGERPATAEPESQASAESEAGASFAKSLSKAFHNAAQEVLPAVVAITNKPKPVNVSEHQSPRGNSNEIPPQFKGTPFEDMFKNDPNFRFFFRGTPAPGMPGMQRRGPSFGSGVIVDSSGVVLTNNHVVSGKGTITVRLQDGREFKAVEIKRDPKSDIAVLKLKDAKNLPTAKLGNSDPVEVGDWVVALGQPFGLPNTVTAGIISAKGRSLPNGLRQDFLQTDAAINPGNSGGPLVNLDGEVIGINTAIQSNTGAYQGVGFAIPINLAKWVGGQLITKGKVHRTYLGVAIQPVDASLANQFGVKVNEGVLISQVYPKTPAADAGLKDGDIIVRFAGKSVSTPQELQGAVEMAPPGTKQKIEILRDGRPMTLTVKADEMPEDFGNKTESGESDEENAEPSRFEKLGIEIEELTPALAEQLNVKADQGVAISDVRGGSPAAMAGLATGMVITQVNNRPVKTVAEFRKALESKPLSKGALFLVRSAQGSRFIVITVGDE